MDYPIIVNDPDKVPFAKKLLNGKPYDSWVGGRLYVHLQESLDELSSYLLQTLPEAPEGSLTARSRAKLERHLEHLVGAVNDLGDMELYRTSASGVADCDAEPFCLNATWCLDAVQVDVSADGTWPLPQTPDPATHLGS